LYEMLCGRRPFIGESRVEVVSMHLTRPVPPPRTVCPAAGISASLERVVLAALEKKRQRRFPSATAFLAALDAVAADAVANASQSRGAGPTWPGWRRLRDWAGPRWIATAAAFVLAIVLVWAFRPHRGPASTPPAPKPPAPEIARP